MEKTIEVGGVQYTAQTLTNLSNRRVKHFKGLMAIFINALAQDLKEDENDIAAALIDYAYVSAQVKGSDILLSLSDPPAIIQQKCITWLTDGDLVILADKLINLVNEVNPKNPDIALAPQPLPENADPKASRAVKNNKTRRARTG